MSKAALRRMPVRYPENISTSAERSASNARLASSSMGAVVSSCEATSALANVVRAGSLGKNLNGLPSPFTSTSMTSAPSHRHSSPG